MSCPMPQDGDPPVKSWPGVTLVQIHQTAHISMQRTVPACALPAFLGPLSGSANAPHHQSLPLPLHWCPPVPGAKLLPPPLLNHFLQPLQVPRFCGVLPACKRPRLTRGTWNVRRLQEGDCSQIASSKAKVSTGTDKQGQNCYVLSQEGAVAGHWQLFPVHAPSKNGALSE